MPFRTLALERFVEHVAALVAPDTAPPQTWPPRRRVSFALFRDELWPNLGRGTK